MKKLIKVLSLIAVTGAMSLGAAISAHSSSKNVKEAEARLNTDVDWDYLAFDSNNFSISGVDDGIIVSDWTTARTDSTFWDTRSYGALDNFYNGFRWEGYTGVITSASWTQTERYITFTLGGNAGHPVEIHKKSDDSVVATVYNTYFHDPEITCNMIVRVVDLNEYIGQSLYLTITDNTTSGFGATSFGALKVSQTEYDVARTISVHKNHLSKRTVGSEDARRDSIARAYILGVYASNAEWTAFDSVELTDANIDFEDYDQLTNLALDASTVVGFAERNDGFDSINWAYGQGYSDWKAWDWSEAFPLCTQGDHFYKGNFGGDGARYSLLTNDFTLTGKGYISVKLGGNGSTLSLLRAEDEDGGSGKEGDVLVSCSNTKFSWYDNGEDKNNNALNDHRPCTMTRYILDATDYVGEKVRIAISDTSTAAWSILMFDELITDSNDLPTFRHDVANQRNTYYRVIRDVLVSNHNDDVKQAYDCLEYYYDNFRSASTFFDLCGAEDKVATLIGMYNALTDKGQTVVDYSIDYDHGDTRTGTWYESAVRLGNKGYSIDDQYVGHAIRYLSAKYSVALTIKTENVFALPQFNNGIIIGDYDSSLLIVISAVALVSLLSCGYFLIRRRKQD